MENIYKIIFKNKCINLLDKNNQVNVFQFFKIIQLMNSH